MTALIPFKFDNFNVRVIPTDDGFNVVAKDVAEALGNVWNAHLLDKVPAEWKGVNPIHTPSGAQEMAILTGHCKGITKRNPLDGNVEQNRQIVGFCQRLFTGINEVSGLFEMAGA